MVGAGAVLPAKVAAELEEVPLDERTGSDDPHTGATYRAVVDVVVPRTPELCGELGTEHGTGGLDVGIDELLPRFIDEFVAPEAAVPGIDLGEANVPGATTEETVPLSEAVAGALEAAAQALLTSGGNEDDPEPGRFGPADGYAALRGYEVQQFREDRGPDRDGASESTAADAKGDAEDDDDPLARAERRLEGER